MNKLDFPETVALDEGQCAVMILDQTLLPNTEAYIPLTNAGQIHDAIYALKVRGAPAIGVTAALGIYVCMMRSSATNVAAFIDEFNETKDYLASARPTAVNLCWALNEMEKSLAQAAQNGSLADCVAALREKALNIKADDIAVCRRIGEYGVPLLSPGMGVLTHCNAGVLAATAYGTALSPIYVAFERGVSDIRVYVDETRPLLQGARLTAYELHRAGINTTLICDNTASVVMQRGFIDAVFVGCDRVAANGDTANKIGTSGVAILANAYGIPFYVCAPSSTLDLACQTGDGIVIEERDGAEVTDFWYRQPMAPSGIKVYNPAFDVTPARYITAFITECGIVKPPYAKTLAAIK